MSKTCARRRILLFVFMPILLLIFGVCKTPELFAKDGGVIRGRVIDSDTKSPLALTTIRVEGSKFGAIADSNGWYAVENLPEGRYDLRFEYVGYLDAVKRNIKVHSGKTFIVNAELKAVGFFDEDMVVSNEYFMPREDQPVSIINLSAEEISQSPGTGNDINRVLNSHPSVAQINDEKNGLVVRGGSPLENTYFVDNIEIPNANHFPTQGSSAGLYSMIDARLIKNADFYSGGYSSKFGGFMSSVINLDLRESKRTKFSGLLDLSFGLQGMIAEGKLFGKKSGWMLSARRSSLNYALDLIDEPLKLPEFRDIMLKADYELSSSDKLNLLNLFGYNFWQTKPYDAIIEGSNWFRDADVYKNIFGLTWRHLWKDKGYSTTSIWHNFARFDQKLRLIERCELFQDINSDEQELGLRNLNYLKFNRMHKMELGIDLRYDYNLYQNYYGHYENQYGRDLPPRTISSMIKALGYGIFASHIFRPFENMSINYGLRVDHSTINQNTHISPRISASWSLFAKSTLSFATGIYYQNLPIVLLSQIENYERLKDPLAYHFILGWRQLLTPSMLLTVEIYDKEYHNCPINPLQPGIFVMDQTIMEEIFMNNYYLNSSGRARSYGVEILLHKKRTGIFYWQIGASYFRSMYKDHAGRWINRINDQRYLTNIEIGFRPNNDWNASVRWSYAGGRPYSRYSFGLYGDDVRLVPSSINAQQFPPYKTTSLRVDRRITLMGLGWTMYFSAFNIFNNQESQYQFVSTYYDRDYYMKQWPRIILLGIEIEY
jgi:hypothetical protein